MALGDSVLNLQQVNAGAYVDIQPAGSDEYEIHCIFFSGDVALQFRTAANYVEFEAIDGPSSVEKCKYTVSNTYFLRVRNTDTGPIFVGWMGVQIA